MGVFATRSPFRPNPIGLSSVKLEAIEKHPKYGMVLRVSGADLMDGTPILDIKPYLAYTDSHPQAKGGFTDELHLNPLTVIIPDEWKQKIPQDKLEALIGVLGHDPRHPIRMIPTEYTDFSLVGWKFALPFVSIH